MTSAPEYFVSANLRSAQVEICSRTTGARAPHTRLYPAEELRAALELADALNAAFNAGVLQGNRTRSR